MQSSNRSMHRYSKFLTSILYLLINLALPNYTLANDNSYNLESNEENIELAKDTYLLGPGDKLNIILGAYPEESFENFILNDGTITIPYIGSININNLSLKEAKEKIQKELKKELLIPEIIIEILETRGLSVLVIGEVNKPGIYSTNEIKNKKNYPFTLFDAIKLAGGLSPEANIENITLQRELSGDNQFKERKINLIKLLKEGDLDQNPNLFDRDVIKIKKVKYSQKKSNDTIPNSNLTGQISVNVIGEVYKPGRLSIESNTPLNQAIYYAGGPKSWRGQKGYVRLIRINSDNTLSSFNIRANLLKGSNKKSNPILRAGDTIIVRRTLIAKSSDALATIAKPLTNILVLDRFIDIIN